MNSVCLLGRLTDDPKISNYTGNDGQTGAIARYTLAVDRPGKKDQGKQNSDFINCVVFGFGAEFAQRYLAKGRRVAITGRLQSGSYTNKDGQKVYTTDVLVSEQNFADSKPQNQQTQNPGYQYQPTPQTPNTAPAPAQPQAQAPQQQYQYYQQMPTQYGGYQGQQMPPQAPPQMPSEQFMQIPGNADAEGLPFN